MSDIRTKVILEVDDSRLGRDISGGINKATNQSQGAVAKSGANMGSVLGRALSAAFSAISTRAILNFANQSVQSFRQVQIAQSTLAGTAQTLANRQQRSLEIVRDSSKSYEEKALAIGFNVDNLYKEERASVGVNRTVQNLNRNVELQERAFEDATRAVEQSIQIKQRESALINRQIDLIRRETQERIKLRRQQLGGDILDEELKQLDAQKDILEVQKAEADILNDPISKIILQNQIDNIEKQIRLRKEKLDVIENETDAIKRQGETEEESLRNRITALNTQVEDLRFQLSDAQNKFDIDIEPARRKLEDLRATAQSVGGGVTSSLSDEFQQALKDFENKPIIDPKTLANQTSGAIENVFNELGVKVGLSRATLQKAVADLQTGGLSDPAEIENTLRRFVKIASTGSLPLTDGVAQLAEQFRNENAALGERAGLTDEYASQIGPRGLAILQAEGKLRGKNFENLTLEERALAKAAGLRQNEEQVQAAFNARLEQGGFAADINRMKFEELQIKIGEDLTPQWNQLNIEIGKYLDLAKILIDENPGLASRLTGVGIAAGVAATAIALLGGPATLIIGGLIGAVAALKAAWDNDIGGIQTQTEALGKRFEEIFTKMGIETKDLQGLIKFLGVVFQQVGGLIGGVLINIGNQVASLFEGITMIVEGFQALFEGRFLDGFTKIFGGLGKIILGPIEFAINNAIDLINSLINGYNNLNDVAGLPDIDPFKKVTITQSFEKGGFPVGANAIVRTNEAGQEYIANARATSALQTFFREIAGDFGASGDQIIDSNNTTSFTQNNFGGPSNSGFRPPYAII